MTSFPGSPRLLKGALVSIDVMNPIPNVIVFQYNPETMTRSLEAKRAGAEGGASSGPQRLEGPPTETISLDVEIDATDQLERADDTAISVGIYPQLSALESLLYPESNLIILNTALLALGTIEIIPPMAPLTLFIWGPKRILPVQLTSFSITEEAYDVNLNPIRAKVSLGMQVQNYNNLPITHPGYHVFMAHHIIKETMATLSKVNDLTAVVGGNINLW